MLKLRHRLDKGGIVRKVLPQDVPELRFAGRPGHGLCLGVQACCGLQTRDLLTQRSSPSTVSSGSCPSSASATSRKMDFAVDTSEIAISLSLDIS